MQDLVLERFDLARKRYMSAGGWQSAEVTRVEIPVRGRTTPVPFEVWETSRGRSSRTQRARMGGAARFPDTHRRPRHA